MDLLLKGKHALVCGSTQGIGKAIAEELAVMGATVILMARNAEKLQQVAAGLPSPHGQEHRYITADFSLPETVKVAVEEFLSVFGRPVHILINNTGGPPSGPITEAPIASFEAAFHAHLVNNHILATTLLPGMRESGYGRIINIISTSVKAPLQNLGVSNTIRGAVANWAKTWANEVAPYGITVNNILPGATETERLSTIVKNKAGKSGTSEEEAAASMLKEIPMKRFGRPEEVAQAAAFLASPSAGYITGINLPVDGGRTPNL